LEAGKVKKSPQDPKQGYVSDFSFDIEMIDFYLDEFLVLSEEINQL